LRYARDVNLRYQLTDVQRAIPIGSLERGKDYAANARVLRFYVDPDGERIIAQVHGSKNKPYTQTIRCEVGFHGEVELEGFCTCPMQFNCKHVAAALLHGLAEAGVLDLRQNALQAPQAPRAEPLPQLDYEVRAWLEALAPAPATAPALRPPSPNKTILCYVLSRDTHRVVRLQLYQARIKKDGRLGGGQPVNRAIGDLLRERPGYVDDSDVPLLEQLLLLALGGGWQGIALEGERALTALKDLAASGRLFWEQPNDNTPLRLGPPRPAQAHWQVNADGSQSMLLTAQPSAEVLPLAAPWYADTTRMEIGPLDCAMSGALARALSLAPRVQPHEVLAVRAALQRVWGDAAPLPSAVETHVVTGAQPECWLRLRSMEAPWQQRRMEPAMFDLAELRFAYEGQFTDRRAELRRLDGNTLRILQRDQTSESMAERQLKQLGLEEIHLEHPYHGRRPGTGLTFAPLGSGHATGEQFWFEFVSEHVPALRARGWRVEIDPSFRFNIVADAQWYALTEQQGNDWFELELGVEIEGQRVSLLPALARLFASLSPQQVKQIDQMRADRIAMLPLEDGRLVPITYARLRPLAALLVELYDRGAEYARLRFSRFDAPRVNELEASLDARWLGGERLRALGQRLRDFSGLREVAAPRGLKAELRPYQRAGLNWLQFLREYELAGVLADDMGLGKTVQTLAHLLVEKESARADLPSLVIAPTSLMHNWSAEAARFAPSLKVLRLQGLTRKRDFERIGAFDVVLSTYPLLARDKDVLLQQPFHYVILDEAQNIKNAKTQAAVIARELNARHRLCLTGTPLENHLGELWSLFHFLLPGFLGGEQQFRELYRAPIEKQGNLTRQAALAKRVTPFMLRRTKDQVAKELPAKTEIQRSVELTGAQRDLYETLRIAMHERVQREIAAKGLARSHIVILDALLKLRQVCCDPRLVKLERAKAVKESAKLDLLMALLPQLIEEGRKVLVFSQFTSMLALIEAELNKAKLAYSLLTGETRDRAAQIDAFQRGERSVFLLSLKAGGIGLNLTAADTVIHYDPWWNPQVERQATDRAHRIGQDKPVFVYKLIVAGSVEEKIVALQEKKAALVRGVLEQDAAALSAMSGADLQALFDPVE
jgi:superfamily II DNA or RNA helicase